MNFEKEYESALKKFDQLNPELVVSVYDRENNTEGFAVVWNTFTDGSCPLGPVGKGGTRIHENLTLDEVKMLAKIMALKNAAAGMPIGGSKSGLRANPKSEGFEKVYRNFVSALKPNLKENGGIFGGFGFDIGADPIHPIWACDELGSTKSFTGKPLEMGGTDYDREGIAGLGVAVSAQTLLEFVGSSPEKVSFSVQGIGAMGAAVFKYFSEMGGKVKYISDPRIGGTVVLPDNLPENLIASISDQNFDETNRIITENKYEKLALDDILSVDVDIFFPCALQDVVTIDNLSDISAKYLVEGANNPCSDEVRDAFHEKGVIVIPDMIANPGGVIAAYVELTSKISPEENVKTHQNVTDAKKLTKEKVSENTKNILEQSKQHNVPPYKVGRLMAYKRILGEDK